MWEFICDTGAYRKRRSCGNNRSFLLVATLLLIIHVTRSTGIIKKEYDKRTGRLVVISSRQFTPGTSGVGEVISVDADEFERLVKDEKISVVRGALVDAANFTVDSSNDTRGSSSADDDGGSGGGGSGEVVKLEHAGVTANLSNGSSGGGAVVNNPVVILPEDSSRGTQQDSRFGVPIDRRKVVAAEGGGGGSGGNSDLSFTGILNGLLDSFINDGPPQQQQQTKPQHKNTTPTPSQPPPTQESSPPQTSEESSLQEEEEEEQEEEQEEEEESSPEESQKKSNNSPQPPPKATTEDISTENVSEYPTDDDEEDIQNQENITTIQKQCIGECRNVIFGLFLCDEIDTDAFCEESGLACCVNNPEPPPPNRYKNESPEKDKPDNEQEPSESFVEDEDVEDDVTSEVQSTAHQQTPPPQQQQFPQQPPHMYRPPPPYPPPQQHYYQSPHQKNPPPMMMHVPPMRMPRPCPRYCVKNYLESYCPERLPSEFACGMDAFCCLHPVNVKEENKQVPEDDEDEQQDDLPGNNDAVGQAGQDDEQPEVAVKKIIGPCTEEVGSCVSKNIVNIICFGHAIPTDMYTCPRTSMKCCARKTALPKEALPSSTTSIPPPPLKQPDNSITRNSSSQQTYQPKHPQQHPQIPPQFVPQQPPPVQQPPIHGYNPLQIHPTPPPLAETPPPPVSPQFQNPFTSPQQLTRTPTRQPVGQYVCGVKGVPTVSKKKRRRKRVVGGSDSLPGEWCWQVALINSLNQYLCGGALIGTQWVLTAAHCVTNIVRSGDAIYVRVGDHDLTSRYGSPGAQTLRVATTYIHHNHNSQTLDNDIALLKLQGNAALKEGVCLVCLPSRNHMSEIPGKRCTVTGYGYMGESGPIPLRIREANLPIVSDDECVRKVNAVTEKVFSLPQSSFCAGGDKSGNDACQGDGGGPLVCRADDPTLPDAGTGYYELTGLVSWGFGCGRESVPGVYVKVSSFIGWIHQIIRSN